jgi:hypothetical protein
MDPRSRAALVNRVSALIGSDRPCPTSWGELSLTEQFLIAERDPEVAQILQGAMLPELELAVLSGTFADQAPAVQTEEQLRRAAIEQWCADHPVLDPAEAALQTNRQVAQARAAVEMSRRESEMVTQQLMAKQATAARGW